MAKYLNTLYEADNGDVYPIRIKTETLAGTIDSPPTAATRSENVSVSQSKKRYGIHARGWQCYRTIAAGANDNLIRYRFIPCLVANDWKDPSRLEGDTITIGGVVWTILRHVPETIR
jgi:hypothetical protein